MRNLIAYIKAKTWRNRLSIQIAQKMRLIDKKKREGQYLIK